MVTIGTIARAFHRATRPTSEIVRAAARVSELMIEIKQHLFAHARIHRGSGSAIEVPDHACSVFHYGMGIMSSTSPSHAVDPTFVAGAGCGRSG